MGQFTKLLPCLSATPAKLRELGSNQRGTCLTDTRNYQQLPSRNEYPVRELNPPMLLERQPTSPEVERGPKF